MRYPVPLAITLAILWSPYPLDAGVSPGSGLSWESRLSGSSRTGIYRTVPAFEDSSSRYILESPLRIMYRGGLDGVGLDAAAVLVPSLGDPALEESDLDMPGAFRMGDPDRILASSSGEGATASLAWDLDRLSLDIRVFFATFTAGRQAVYWGVARSVSPTDFIAPFRYGTVDTEYRPGVDALRAVFPMGMMSELDAGVALGRGGDADSSAAWLRGRFYILRTDLTLLAARSRNDLVAGGSVNLSTGGGTGWVETAVVDPGHFEETENGQTYWTMSAGYDRSWFGAELYGYLEYHFSSPGTGDPSEYAETSGKAAITSGSVYLLGRHYLCPGLSWTPAPLWRLSSTAMVNLSDPSSYVTLAGEYDIGQDTALQWGACFGLGEDPGSEGAPVSEFGSWPDIFYARVAFYF